MLLVLDNGSVFTRELLDLLGDIGAGFERATPGKLGSSEIPRFDSYILSGRTRNDAQMNALNSGIIRHAISDGKPLLGICYGAEILALTLGGSIRRMDDAHRGEETVRVLAENPLCRGTVSVFESHRYEIARLGGCLVSIGRSERCRHELIRLDDADVFGVQFHPEMSDDGRAMIEKFVSL